MVIFWKKIWWIPNWKSNLVFCRKMRAVNLDDFRAEPWNLWDCQAKSRGGTCNLHLLWESAFGGKCNQTMILCCNLTSHTLHWCIWCSAFKLIKNGEASGSKNQLETFLIWVFSFNRIRVIFFWNQSEQKLKSEENKIDAQGTWVYYDLFYSLACLSINRHQSMTMW